MENGELWISSALKYTVNLEVQGGIRELAGGSQDVDTQIISLPTGEKKVKAK